MSEKKCLYCDLKKPDTKKPFFALCPELAERVENGMCVNCQGDILSKDFTSKLSRKEYSISGLCQECQEIAFSGDSDA